VSDPPVNAMPVVDGHSDAMMDVARRRLRGERAVLARRHLPALRAGGVAAQFLMVGGDFPLFSGDSPEVDHLRQSLELIEAFHSERDETPDDVLLVRTREDLEAVRAGDAVGFILHWEGVTLAHSVSMLRTAWRLGLRSAGLTWNTANRAADGSGTHRDAGLTDYGRALVTAMNELGIVVDVSHLSDRGVREVCELSTKPVIASHTNARAVFDHPRNLPDEHMRLIADTGGVVGACAYPVMLTARERPGIPHIVGHIEHMCSVLGAEHVGLGCDFVDGISELWCDSAYMHEFRAELSRPFPEGFETISDLPRLRDALVAAGFEDDDLAGIMGGNFLRVLGECLPSADPGESCGNPIPIPPIVEETT
jgi:membrane dipeptidase